MPNIDHNAEVPILPTKDDINAEISKVQSDYAQNYLKYYGYARLFTPSRATAEDLVQQAFVNIIDAIEKGHSVLDETLSAYMKRIIRNISITNYRKESVQPTLRIVEAQTPSPESEFDLSVDQQLVAEAISELTQTQRSIIVMYYFDGLKAVEIAEKLNIDASSVRTHLLRARQSIAESVNYEEEVEVNRE